MCDTIEISDSDYDDFVCQSNYIKNK